MKVACICNMNNNLFSLVRFLRDCGIDAELLLFEKESPQFHPSADTFTDHYSGYTFKLSWGKPADFLFFTRSLEKRVASDLEKYDFIIGSGLVPAYLHKIGRSLDVFIPHGNDLYAIPFFKLFKRESLRDKVLTYILHKHQKSGIQSARYIVDDSSASEIDSALDRIGIKGKHMRCATPMLYTPLYDPAHIHEYYGQSSSYEKFKEIRDEHDLVIFHHARHLWKGLAPYDSKGNDQLFQGFKKFLNRNAAVSACIVTCEYGEGVSDTKNMIRDLGIEDRVYWFPLLSRKEIIIGLSICDIGTGDFEYGWLCNGVIYEVLSMAKPLMHYRDDALHENVYPDLYPIMNVKGADMIANALHDYMSRPNYFRNMGEKGRQWLQSYAVEAPLNVLTNIIRSSSDESGLNSSLSKS